MMQPARPHIQPVYEWCIQVSKEQYSQDIIVHVMYRLQECFIRYGRGISVALDAVGEKFDAEGGGDDYW